MTLKSSPKTQIIVSIITGIFVITAAVASSPHWFKYFFPDQFIEQEMILSQKTKKDSPLAQQNSEGEKKEGTEHIAITKIELSPVSSKIPSYFLVEIKNEGTKSVKDLSVIIDLGRGEYEQLEFIGYNNNLYKADTSNTNVFRIELPTFRENEIITIYALLSLPVFKSIAIDGSNLRFAKEYTYEEYIKSEDSDSSSNATYGFIIFLLFLFAAILIVLAIYFLRIVYTTLARKQGWDNYS